MLGERWVYIFHFEHALGGAGGKKGCFRFLFSSFSWGFFVTKKRPDDLLMIHLLLLFVPVRLVEDESFSLNRLCCRVVRVAL